MIWYFARTFQVAVKNNFHGFSSSRKSLTGQLQIKQRVEVSNLPTTITNLTISYQLKSMTVLLLIVDNCLAEKLHFLFNGRSVWTTILRLSYRNNFFVPFLID